MKKIHIDEIIKAPLYTGDLNNFIPAPKDYPIFNGAIYYKCVSSRDMWLGIEATITIPKFIPDESRCEDFTDVFGTFRRYLDSPSVYLGGSSDHETDIGFGFFRGIIDGKITDTKAVFRPFWRTIYMEDNEEKNVYSASKIEEAEFFYYPGDKIKVHLVCLEENYLSFRIELLEETTLFPYTEYRKIHPNKPFYIDRILAPGNGIRDTEYKRVNAIDQHYNEGKPTKSTKAQAVNAAWEDVNLFRNVDGEIVKVPFNGTFEKKIFAPSENFFDIKHEENKELINIGFKNEVTK